MSKNLGICCFAAFFILIGVIPPVAVSIASLVIASEHRHESCDDGAVMSLSVWLIVYGSVTLAITFFSLILVGLGILMESKGAFLVIFITTILSSLWIIAWNIVGAVSLFRDSMDCLDDAKPVWIMTLVVLILQWLSLIYNCCCSGKNRMNDD